MRSHVQTDPHLGQPVIAAGVPLEQAQAVVILVHGRGSSPADILSLAQELMQTAEIARGVTFLAPGAAGGTWYPYPFRVHTTQNEPYLTSALASLGRLVEQIRASGLDPVRIVLAGFSQGACLALEWIARNAQRFGGVAGLSGGLIGADGETRQDRGDLAGTPVFLGCSDVDFHIPKHRVEWSARVLSDLGGQVTMRLYPGMGHLINQDEFEGLRQMVLDVLADKEPTQQA